MERTLHDHPRQVLTVPGDSLLPDFADYVASREANEADIARALTETGAAAIAAAQNCLKEQIGALDTPPPDFAVLLLQHVRESIGARFGGITDFHLRSVDTHRHNLDAGQEGLDRALARKLNLHLDAHVGETISMPGTVVDTILQPIGTAHDSDRSLLCDPRVLRNLLSSEHVLALKEAQDAPGMQMFDIAPIEERSEFVTLQYRAANPRQAEVYLRGDNNGKNVPWFGERCLRPRWWKKPPLSLRLDLSHLPPMGQHNWIDAWRKQTSSVFSPGMYEIILQLGSFDAKRHGVMQTPMVRGRYIGDDGDHLHSAIFSHRLYAIRPDLLEEEEDVED